MCNVNRGPPPPFGRASLRTKHLSSPLRDPDTGRGLCTRGGGVGGGAAKEGKRARQPQA